MSKMWITGVFNTDLYDLYPLQSNKIFITLLISFFIIFCHVAHCTSDWHLLKRAICNGPNTIDPIPALCLSLSLCHPPSSPRFSPFSFSLFALPLSKSIVQIENVPGIARGSLSAHFFENYLRLRSFCGMNIWCGGPERLPDEPRATLQRTTGLRCIAPCFKTHTHTHTSSSHPTHHHTPPKKHSRRFMAGYRIRRSAS